MQDNNFGIIFDEGPIARCLFETAKREKFKFKEIIYLGGKNILPQNFYINYNFKFHNSKPIKFLKKRDLSEFINDVEDYFDLGNNFFSNAYSNTYINNKEENFNFVKNKSVNSSVLFEKISKSKSNFFLNTGKQILKNPLKLNKFFLHIHPAILPDIKGADGSLWNIKKKNCFGGTLFVLNEKIDEGEIIFKTELKLKKFNISYKKFSNILYDIWFSFIDPAIRCYVFKNSINNRKLENITKSINIGGEYFSFMDNEIREKILKKILTQ
ncbi:hypothetical protein OA187_02085 [Candidatus Pelagibacter sp.]|nr:hypothetical protein [Candidatus Pelagibacter sp.]